MRDQYIFDIPVYRVNSAEFDKETKLLLAKRLSWLASFDPQRRLPNRRVKERELQSLIAAAGGAWQFNQTVGWLRLFAEGSTIGCHTWWVDAKRLNRRMRQRRLYLTTHSDTLGTWFPAESSAEIFDTLLTRLSDMAANPPYINRHVDLESFRRVGPFIDWRGILDSLAAQPIDQGQVLQKRERNRQ